MPEDKEELALTLNGKKARIKRSDFENSIIASAHQVARPYRHIVSARRFQAAVQAVDNRQNAEVEVIIHTLHHY